VMANWCFGVIDSSERFCVAPKLLHHTHCGIPAHAKRIRKRNKAKVKSGAYYAPGGSVHGRPMAKINPMIKRNNVPSKFRITFQTGKLTTSKWKDLIINAKTDIGDSGEEEDLKTNYDDDEEIEDKGTIPSGFDEAEYDDGQEFNFQWEGELNKLGGDANWALTARAH
jgi:hypothetical protein